LVGQTASLRVERKVGWKAGLSVEKMAAMMAKQSVAMKVVQ
jgi:hypothetical protein